MHEHLIHKEKDFSQSALLSENVENRVTFFHICAFIILLPFDRFYGELVLISLLLHTFIHLNSKKLKSIFSFQNLVLTSVFFLNLLGIIYSMDRGQAMKDAQRQLAILIFPVILSLTNFELAYYRSRILKVLAFTAVFTIVYLYGDAIHIILYNKLSISTLFNQVFINQNFSEPIGIHATYLAMQVALALAVMLNLFLNGRNGKDKTFYFIGVAILSAGLIQLSSRSVLLAVLVVILIVIPFSIPVLRKRLSFILFSLVIIATGFMAVSRIDSFRKRYVADFQNDLTQASINNEVLESRALRWNFICKQALHSPVVGYGSGSERRLLNEIYYENKLYNSYLNQLNAHNQYLSVFIKTGAIGLFIFLLTLFYGFRHALKEKDLILIAFLVIFSFVAFSENCLDVNKGIFFYAFFFSFLLKSKPAKFSK